MDLRSGDIIYATLVIGTAIVGYRTVRSATMSTLNKVIMLGVCLAFLFDLFFKFGASFSPAQHAFWKVISPDRTMLAGAIIGLALALRDRYAPMISEAGFAVKRMKRDAEADLKRQRQENNARIKQENRAAREQLEREMSEAKERLEKELDKTKGGDLYKTLGVARDATKGEIKKAYRKLISQYHPDKAHQTTPEIQKLAEERVKDINWAFEQLRN